MTWLLLVGLVSTVQMGESSPGLLVQAGANTAWLEAGASWDSTDKVPGAGWIGSGWMDLGQTVTAGLGYSHRDGGAWAKDSLWWRVGVGRGIWRLRLRGIAWATTGPRVTVAEGRWRVFGRRYGLEVTQGVAVYDGQIGYVGTGSVGVRWGR